MKIICIGRNYGAHAKELGNEVPKQPLIFMKPPSALLVNDKPFYYPSFSDDVHYECELVVKISKNGRSIEEKFAHRYYKEVGLGIDFTARDLQSQLKAKGQPWEIAKGFDHSAVLSKFIPIEEHHRTEGFQFSLEKNGEKVQQGDTKNLIFSIDYLIAYISQYFRLQLGDYIFTGTPKGVGPVQIGDTLEGYIGERKMFRCDIK